MSGPDGPTRVAQYLVAESGIRGLTVTWLNHWSIQKVDWEMLRKVDFVGVDGTFLQLLLASRGKRVTRSSADLVVPKILEAAPERRIALVGGAPDVAKRAAERLSNVVFTTDGFDGTRALLADSSPLYKIECDLIVLGLGTGLQEQVAIHLRHRFPDALILTAGGWLDQLAAKEQYFPPIVHALRLGWLWRILHEPKRLTRRYTVDAVSALKQRQQFASRMESNTSMILDLGFQGLASK